MTKPNLQAVDPNSPSGSASDPFDLASLRLKHRTHRRQATITEKQHMTLPRVLEEALDSFDDEQLGQPAGRRGCVGQDHRAGARLRRAHCSLSPGS